MSTIVLNTRERDMYAVRPKAIFGRSVSFGRRPGILALVMGWDARFRARRALETLGPDRLRDLGLTAAEIEEEVSKPFWRA
jgi:uncharacterized protein YjiS (DUF1127 family)